MRRTTKALCVLGLAGVLALSGCGQGGGGGQSGGGRPKKERRVSAGRAGGSAVDTRRDANEVVAEAVNRQAVLTSLAGDGVLALVDPAKKLNHRVNAEVVASEGPRLRITGTRLNGSIHAFDLLLYDNEVLFHDGMNKVVYTGAPEDLAYLAIPVQPQQVLEQLLRPATELTYQRWRSDTSRPGDVQGSLAYVSDGGWRVLVDRRSGVLVRIEQYQGSTDGSPVMVRTLGSYRLVANARSRTGTTVTTAPVFAYMQRIEWPRDGRKVEFTFKRVVPDAPLDRNDFNVKFSDRAQRRPLRQAGFDPSGL